MRISDMLKKEYIIEELMAKTQREVLAELSSVFLRADNVFDHQAMVTVLLEREKLGSTGIGEGVAIPHGKVPDIGELMISFGRSKHGVDFNALDGKPVHLFFLLVAPEDTTGKHLRVLAKLSRMLKSNGFKKSLMESRTVDDLYRTIVEKDDEYPE